MHADRKLSAIVLTRRSIPWSSPGFTLVELMMTLAISFILVAALYSAYLSQQRSQIAQGQVTDLQQNVRAAVEMMTAEIRMAGFNPQGSAGSGIVVATRGRFQFTRDMETNGIGVAPGDGDITGADENVTYGFADADDATRDGIADAGAAWLGRNSGAGFSPIAENIQAVEFLYLVGDNLTPTPAPSAAELANIRAVTITVLARAANPDRQFTSAAAYTSASGAVWNVNDNFRRRLYTTTVKLRNMGL